TAKLSVVVHYPTRQVVDQLLADRATLLACHFCDCLRDSVGDFILPFIRHDLVNGTSDASRGIYFYGQVRTVYTHRRARVRASRANVGTSLEPFASPRTLEEPRCKDFVFEFQGFDWWAHKDSNLGPAIKRQPVRRLRPFPSGQIVSPRSRTTR